MERAAPAAAAEADENLTWGTCLECRGYKLGEVDEFDDRFFCLECWDMWELQEDQVRHTVVACLLWSRSRGRVADPRVAWPCCRK